MELALERAYHWEATRPNDVFLTQPMGKGVVKDFTFKETLDHARRVAAYLTAMNLL